MKKCPPGVLCIERLTMGVLVIAAIVAAFVLFRHLQKQQPLQINLRQDLTQDTRPAIPSYPYNNLPPYNVLQDAYAPPYKDNRYFVNVPTNIGVVDTNYRQMGMLTPVGGPNVNNILPLMGRPLYVSRSKYQYYAISNQHNNIKLPIRVKGRAALNDNGVDELFTGDTVFVEGYNEPFRVTLYENETIQYLPFL